VRISLREALEATGGRLEGPPNPDLLFESVSTDTRTLAPGALFVALRGPRHDGHDHLIEALRRGAAGVVVERGPVPPGAPAVRVSDTLSALGALGRRARRKLGAKVLAITGSVGKTTTKEMAAAILRAQGVKTLQTPGNRNNRVGLPLTLLGARGDEETAVLELGINERGEMAHLTAICEPDAAVVTAVAECHTEGLGSLAEVAREKLSIARGLRPGGILVLPHGDPLLAPPAGVRVITFGWDGRADVVGRDFEGLGAEGSRFRVDGTEIRLGLAGRHQAQNALAALAALRALGAGWERAAEGLAAVRPVALRGEIRRTQGGVSLLVDCYNANPKAVEAALETLRAVAGSARAIAIVGEMRELGPLSREAHARVGRAAGRVGVDELHLLGAEARAAEEAAAAAGLAADRIWRHEDRGSLAAFVAARVRPGDWVLIKGSRSLGLEAVAEALEQGLGPEAASASCLPASENAERP